MSSSSPGKWNKNNFLPQIKNPYKRSSKEHGEDFDIDSFDKLLDELTHENPIPRIANLQDESRASGSKMASDFHLPSIESTSSTRAKSAMERKRKHTNKYSHVSKLDVFQSKTYGLGKRSIRILNKELRSIVSGVAVPLPPMKTSLLSSLVDPMESIPEEPSNTSVDQQASPEKKLHQADEIESSNDKPSTLNTINTSDVGTPPSRSSRCSEEVVINSFYDDALKTEDSSSSSNIPSRWSPSPTFDCGWDPPVPATQTYPFYSNARPRAPKRISLGQYGSQKDRYGAGGNRSNILNTANSVGTRRFVQNTRETNQTIAERDVESRNRSPSASWGHSREVTKVNISASSRTRGSRQTSDGRQSYRSIDDWLRKSALSKSKSPSSGSSLSVGTLAPIQEVSSSSENSSSKRSTGKKNNKMTYHRLEYLTEDSEDTTDLGKEKDVTKMSPSNSCIDGPVCPLKDLNPSTAFNMDFDILSNTGERTGELTLYDCNENNEVTENDVDISLEKKCVSSRDRSLRASPISHRSSSSRSIDKTHDHEEYLSEAGETIATRISEISSSVTPASGSLVSKQVEKGSNSLDDNQSLHSVENIPSEKSKCIQMSERSISHPPSEETTQGRTKSKPDSQTFSKYNESLNESLSEIQYDSPPSCWSWEIVPHHEDDQELNTNTCDLDESKLPLLPEHENSPSHSLRTEVMKTSACEHEEKLTSKNTALTNDGTEMSFSDDFLKSIPRRNPQTYIASWRTYQHVPKKSTKCIGYHEVKPLSHISEGSTYSLSSSWKILSSDDGKISHCDSEKNTSYPLSICNTQSTYSRYVSRDTIYSQASSADSYALSENKADEETPSSSARRESIQPQKCLVVYQDRRRFSPKPEETSPVSIKKHDTTLIASLPPSLNCEDKIVTKIQTDNCDTLITTERKNVGFQDTCDSDSEESKGSKLALHLDVRPMESLNSLQKRSYQVSADNRIRFSEIPSTETIRTREDQDVRKPHSAETTQAETIIMSQPLQPPVANCYVNYPQTSVIPSTSNRSIHTRSMVQGAIAHSNNYNSAPSTSVFTDAPLIPHNLQTLILTSNNEPDMNNQNSTRQMNHQFYVIQSHVPVPRQCGILSIDTAKQSIPSCAVSQSENVLEPETILANNNFNDSPRLSDISESVVYQDVNPNESSPRESTQITLVENANYIFITPTLNETYISPFPQPLTPGTVFVSTRTSKDNAPLFPAPSESNFFRGSPVTQILVTSETPLEIQEIIELPMDNVFVTTSHSVSRQKLIMPPENMRGLHPFNDDLHQQFQAIPTAICKHQYRFSENSCGQLVESGIEIVELTSTDNEISTKTSDEPMPCGEDAKKIMNIEKYGGSGKENMGSQGASNEENTPHIIKFVFPSTGGLRKRRSKSVGTLDGSSSSRTPSPVPSDINESERSNSPPESEITESVNYVTSEASDIDEANDSIRSSQSSLFHLKDPFTKGSKITKQRDRESDLEIIDLENNSSHDECLPRRETSRNLENVYPRSLVERHTIMEVPIKKVSKHEINQYHDRTDKYDSESSTSLSIESIAIDDSNLISCSCKIPRSPSTKTYVSSDFDSSESGLVPTSSFNVEEKDSLSSVIMGTPPRRSSRLPPVLTLFHCDTSPSPYYSSECGSHSRSLSEMYSDSDFEVSPSRESIQNPKEVQYCSSEEEYKIHDSQEAEELLSAQKYRYSDASVISNSLKSSHKHLVCRYKDCNSDTILTDLSSYRENKIQSEKSKQDLNSVRSQSPTSGVESSKTLQDKSFSTQKDLDSDVEAINKSLVNMELLVNIENSHIKPIIADTYHKFETSYQVDIVHDRLPCSDNSKRNNFQSKNLTQHAVFPHRTKCEETRRKVDTERKKKYLERRNVSKEDLKLSHLTSFKANAQGSPSTRNVIENEISTSNTSFCYHLNKYPSYHSHKYLNLKSDKSDSCHTNIMTRRKKKFSICDSGSNMQESVEPTDNIHSQNNKNGVANAQRDTRSSESSASHYTSYYSHGSRKQKKNLRRLERKLAQPSEISNDSLDVLNYLQPYVSKSSTCVSVPSHSSHKQTTSRSNVTNLIVHEETISDFTFNVTKEQSRTPEVSDQSSVPKGIKAPENSRISELIQKHVESSDTFRTTSNMFLEQIARSRNSSSNASTIPSQFTQVKKFSKTATENQTILIHNEAESKLSYSDRNEEKIPLSAVHTLSRMVNQSDSLSNDRGDLAASTSHPLDRKRYIESKFSDSEKAKNILAHLWFAPGNDSKTSRYSPRKAPLTRRSESTVTKQSNILKHSVLSEMAKSAMTFSRIAAHFPTTAHLSPRIIEASLNSRIARRGNEQTVDCLLPVRTLRTYSLEAVSPCSQLELALVQWKMQVRSSPDAAFMRNLGRCATSLVSLPHPSSKNDHASDSCVGSFRSSFDSESSETSNEEPKCHRRHTRPCVQIETKASPKDFRTPLASSHAFASEISTPVEVSNNRIETIYSAHRGKENKIDLQETGSNNVGSFKKYRRSKEDLALCVPFQTLLPNVSNEWLEITRDAPLDVLIGIETTESRPKSPPPHATREGRQELKEDISIDRLLGIDIECRPRSPPAHATRRNKRDSNISMSAPAGPVTKMEAKSCDALDDKRGDENVLGISGTDRVCSAPDKSSNMAKLQMRKNDPHRCVHFSPKITYISRTRENSSSNTSKVSGSRSYRRTPIKIRTEDKIELPDSETRKVSRPNVSDSCSRLNHDRDVSSANTVTLYRSEASSDSSSYGLLSLHQISHSSKARSWCTADDSTDETLSNFSTDVYYPLPGLEDYSKIDSAKLVIPSVENQTVKLTTNLKEKRGRDRSSDTGHSLSSHMGLIRDTAIKSLLSASESLGVSVGNTEIPLAYRRPNETSTCDILSPPHPTTRHSETENQEGERPSQYASLSKTKMVPEMNKSPSIPTASSSKQDAGPVTKSMSRTDNDEDYYHVCNDSEMYNAFRMEKLYSGSSITDGTASWPNVTPMLYRGKNPGLEDIPSMCDLRRRIRTTTPPYGARYGAPYYAVRREQLEGGDVEATEAGQEQQRRLDLRRERRAERRQERQRQLLGVQARRPFSSGNGDDGSRRRRRQRFTRLRQCFEGIGDAIFTVFTRCCD